MKKLSIILPLLLSTACSWTQAQQMSADSNTMADMMHEHKQEMAAMMQKHSEEMSKMMGKHKKMMGDCCKMMMKTEDPGMKEKSKEHKEHHATENK